MSLHDPQEDFVVGDSFLFAVLGLARGIAGLRPALPDAGETAASSQSVPAEDDAILHALLGVITLGERIDSVLQGWKTADIGEFDGSPPVSGFDVVDELLR